MSFEKSPHMQTVTYISGATGYVGSRLAMHRASNGDNLLLSSKDVTNLRSLCDDIRAYYPDVLIECIPCDLANPENWSEATEAIQQYRVRNYVNCSGIQGQLSKCTDISINEMTYVFNVNLFSSIYFTNFFASRRRDNEQLSIIHFSGGGATSPRPLFMSYSLSKTALVRFVENFAEENRVNNLQINAIAPGVHPSRMQAEVLNNPLLTETNDYLMARKALLNPEGDISRLMKLCDFLLSEDSKYVNGKLISAEWDNWPNWSNHIEELVNSDLYTLRRITGRDRGMIWSDL